MKTNKPLQSVVVTSAVSSITFSGIDQSYTDLLITADFTISVSNASVFMRFNGDTSTSYSDTTISGTGANRYTDRDANGTQIRVSAQRTAQTATDRQHFTIHINDYANNTTYKTCLSRYGSIGGVEGYAGQWRKTTAINSITFGFGDAYTFSPGTTISLYGIKAGTPKAVGGQLFTDNNYWYHVFTTTQSFAPTQALTADILVVAGGGGGGAGTNGSNGGGGGGAGGLLAFTSQALTANTSYAVTVGAGGVGNGGTGVSTNGTDSQFGALTLVKGGGSGGSNYGTSASWPGGNGGSGGGGYGRLAAGGSPTSGQGYAGGTGGADTPSYAGAGGGGAGAAGANGNSASIAGAGGIGLNTWSSWATATGTGVGGYYAGGGAGGSYASTAATGGSGGGGNGGSSAAVATNGTTNTGGGGGASGGSSTGAGIGARGGSGIVIVRYAV